MKVKISSDFSRFPSGRYHPEDGNITGQLFRERFLEPHLKNGDEILEVDLDGVVGYPTSFLEEAFGGLIRAGFPMPLLQERLKIIAHEQRRVFDVKRVWRYIEDAAHNNAHV